MDEEKLDEALKDINSPVKNRDPRDRLEIESALRSWSGSIQQMLDGRFGKGKVIHLLVLAPTGRETTLSWISSANFESVKATIAALMERFKFLDSKAIIIDPKHFGG